MRVWVRKGAGAEEGKDEEGAGAPDLTFPSQSTSLGREIKITSTSIGSLLLRGKGGKTQTC